jgi:hypothetical protein
MDTINAENPRLSPLAAATVSGKPRPAVPPAESPTETPVRTRHTRTRPWAPYAITIGVTLVLVSLVWMTTIAITLAT